MRTLIDFDGAPVFAIPVHHGAGGLTVRTGMLLEGPQGWGEFSPWPNSTGTEIARWLTAATEPGTVAWPEPLRGQVPVAASVPAVEPMLAAEIAAASGCRVAEVAVGGRSIDEDVARVIAVRDALGPGGAVRCDAAARWDVDTAVRAVDAITAAVGEVQYVQQPCASLDDVAAVRRRVDVRIAARVPVDLAGEAAATMRDAADVAVLTAAPLGGVRRALRMAEILGLPCVVASTFDTSIGLSASVALAGSLPDLPFACAVGTRALLAGDVVTDARSLLPRDGFVPVAPTPPAPSPELLRRYVLADPVEASRWRELLRLTSST